MMIARVIGTLVSTRKEPTLDGLRVVGVPAGECRRRKNSASLVAADAVAPAWEK